MTTTPEFHVSMLTSHSMLELDRIIPIYQAESKNAVLMRTSFFRAENSFHNAVNHLVDAVIAQAQFEQNDTGSPISEFPIERVKTLRSLVFAGIEDGDDVSKYHLLPDSRNTRVLNNKKSRYMTIHVAGFLLSLRPVSLDNWMRR